MNRSGALDRLRSETEPLDILIIGGGATGLGAAVDAASRGHRVALIERSDFAKGTSSRSTKLVHGGLRYLRQGHVPLVLEALRERGRLTRNAPHLVHDLAFVIPNYKWWEGPFYSVGLKVYDQLAGDLGLKQSRHLSREETLQLIPTVESDHLTSGVIYHDGQFDDARLAINLAQTAVEQGGVVANYCECVGLIKEAGRVAGAQVRDIENGAEFELRARVVINATGVFVDDVRRHDDASASPMVAPSQGVHLVLPKRFMPGDVALMIPKTSDGRVLFVIPWHGCVVVGTTDTPVPRRSAEPRALDAEREFLLSHARRYLANDPTDADVLSIFAGLRPLVKSGVGTTTAALSRDHTIATSASGLITITGGKWTTYRKMSEDVINHAEQTGSLSPRACITARLPIHGATAEKNPSPNLQPYGTDAAAIAGLSRDQPELAAPLHALLPYQKAEVLWHARAEMARSVEDVLARRTRALLLDARASIAAAPIVAELLAAELQHDTAWQRAQVESYTGLARGYVFTDPASRGS
jgi:glycerol-3-phosphate dehydrogenase